jgi:hypothetical protein
MKVLTIENAQQDNGNIKRIFYLAEAREIDGCVVRGGIPFRKVDNDLRIVVSVSLKPRLIRQAYRREKHFSVAIIGTLLDKKSNTRNPSLRNKIRKESRRRFSRKRKRKRR